jgi:hypothetical protein
VAAILIGFVAFNPSSAIARQQQQQHANSYKPNNDTTTTTTATTTNSHKESMPKITGSINILQTIKDRIKVSFSEAASTAQKEVSLVGQ